MLLVRMDNSTSLRTSATSRLVKIARIAKHRFNEGVIAVTTIKIVGHAENERVWTSARIVGIDKVCLCLVSSNYPQTGTRRTETSAE